MNGSHVQASNALVKPLNECVVRCDPFMRKMSGGMYGYTRTDGSGARKFHGGVDLFAETGTETFAMGKGRVEWINDFKGGWGKCVLATLSLADSTCWALYAHLSEIYVKKGSPLEPRTMIGLTGISGNGDSDYPHLHLETWSSMAAGKMGTREKYRFDPLDLLGFLPYQPYAVEVVARSRQA